MSTTREIHEFEPASDILKVLSSIIPLSLQNFTNLEESISAVSCVAERHERINNDWYTQYQVGAVLQVHVVQFGLGVFDRGRRLMHGLWLEGWRRRFHKGTTRGRGGDSLGI